MLKNWLWSYVVIVLLRLLPESALVSHIGPFGGVFITLAIFLLYPKVSALLKIRHSRPLGTRLTTLRPGRNKKVQARL
ncbi:MAG: hypothetical protein ACI3Y7_04890 [Candidatus Cryptobacteroides sp.]